MLLEDVETFSKQSLAEGSSLGVCHGSGYGDAVLPL